MLNIDTKDTIVAIATAAGSGAIAVVRLSGAAAWDLVNQFFRAKDLNAQNSHTIHLGFLRNEADEIIDQVLVSLFRAPHSYTRENVVEISCHGSPYIQQQILELFIRAGARMAQQGEFTLRAFLNGGLDLTQAEAVADLISSDSSTSHELAIRQIRGGFSNIIKVLREKLIHFASLLELELDFGEEDVEFANRAELAALLTDILSRVRHLSDSFQLGNVLKNGVSTVLAGRPNAGKSTLLNALLNEERAIVSEIAGTTRDAIEENLTINGVVFRLIDTAGIREATDKIEAVGVARTFEKVSQSTILVYVYDATLLTQKEVAADLAELRTYSKDIAILVVANKIDAIFAGADMMLFQQLNLIPASHLRISAKYKQDLERLRDSLYQLVAQNRISRQGNQNTVVSNSRHYEALLRADRALHDALSGLQNGVSGDWLAMDIRHALRYLGEITGDVDVEDLLDNIFSKFCIGK
jgi:tRNA modification GTPase